MTSSYKEFTVNGWRGRDDASKRWYVLEGTIAVHEASTRQAAVAVADYYNAKLD